MPNLSGEIPIDVLVDGCSHEAHTTYLWAGGGRVLTISTVLPERPLAAEFISTYVGHPTIETVATHLLLGPVADTAEIRAVEHPHQQVDPAENPRTCAYDHANALIETLRAKGFEVSVRMDERSFLKLERVE